MVHVYARGEQIAVHVRDHTPGGYTTVKEHLSSHHQHYLERSPAYYIEKAKSRSHELYLLTQLIFDQSKPPEQSYRTCDGLLRLQRITPSRKKPR